MPPFSKNQKCVLTYFALIFSLLHVNQTYSSIELQFITKYLKYSRIVHFDIFALDSDILQLNQTCSSFELQFYIFQKIHPKYTKIDFRVNIMWFAWDIFVFAFVIYFVKKQQKCVLFTVDYRQKKIAQIKKICLQMQKRHAMQVSSHFNDLES